MQKLPKINIFKLKKILQNKGYKIYKNQKTIPKSFENFFYITILGVFLIGIFYVTPFIIDFSKKKLNENEIVLNNSSINFNRVLEGKEIQNNRNLKEDDEVDFKDLFTDVFEFDINEQDTVRLSASTLNQLFIDENYNLTIFTPSTKQFKKLGFKNVLPAIPHYDINKIVSKTKNFVTP